MRKVYRYDEGVGGVVEVSGDSQESEAPNARVVADRHFASSQLPRNYKYASKFDSEGRPAFSSMRDVREMVARARDHGEDITYEA